MRALLLAQLLVGDATFTESHACYFVGSRFAQTYSVCEAELCSNLFRLDSGVFTTSRFGASLVTCGEAREVAEAFLAERAHAQPPDAHPSAGEIIRHLKDEIIPILDELAFGIEPSRAVGTILAKADQWLLNIATTNMTVWTTVTVPALVSSVAIDRLSVLYVMVIRIAMSRPVTYSSLLRSVYTSLYFYFDFSAILGVPFIHPQALEFCRNAMPDLARGYRTLTRWESPNSAMRQGVAGTVGDVLAVSVALELGTRATMSEENILVLYSLFTGWSTSEESTAKSLLHEQILVGVCPRLTALVHRFAQTHAPSQTVVRVALALVDVCRDSISAVARARIRTALLEWTHRAVALERLPGGAFAVPLLESKLPFAWAMGLGDEDPPTTAKILLDEFIAERVWFVPVDAYHQTFVFDAGSSNSCHGFGRALGLAILHGVDLTFLRLPLPVVKLLHPRFRLTAGGVAAVAASIAPTSPGAVLLVAAGLEEVLGLGGPEIVTDSEWVALFHPPL